MMTLLGTLRRLAHAKNAVVLVLAVAVFVAIVAFESVAPLNVVGAYAFVIPILLVATVRNRMLMYVAVVLCVAVTYMGLFQPAKKRERFTAVLINRTLVVGVLVSVAYFAMTREERKAREEAARAELLRANAQLVEQKDRLNRSDRLAALGLLASSVAHEVGTPLHSIAWQVQMLAEDPHATPEMKKTLAIIESELNRVVRIIKEKLSLTRQPKPAYAPLRLDHLAQSVVALMEPAYIGKGVGLKADLGLEPAVVLGDVEQLRQVLVNLLTNALAATEAGGQVVLVVGRRAATLAELDERRRGHGAGHGLRDARRACQAGLRAVLHHQGDRRRNGAGPLHQPRDHHLARRLAVPRERGGEGDACRDRVAGVCGRAVGGRSTGGA